MTDRRAAILLRVEVAVLAILLVAQLVACARAEDGAVNVQEPLVAIDGDTLRAGTERIRLVGIDSPELHHCRQGRVCAAGDPVRAKATLAGQLGGHAEILRLGHDRYGRTIAAVRVGGVDLSCY